MGGHPRRDRIDRLLARLSRVFPTDVLAGWMLGVAWAVAVIVIPPWWTGNRDYSRTPALQRDR